MTPDDNPYRIRILDACNTLHDVGEKYQAQQMVRVREIRAAGEG